jgi:tRNA uridine 5-carboxymethylaminomethyl modification enzyme
MLRESGTEPIDENMKAVMLLRRPGVAADALARSAGCEIDAEAELLAAVEVELKYEGYVARERERASKLRAQLDFVLDHDLPYASFITLSREAREKLAKLKPPTLAHAGRVSGVSPADLQNLVLEVRRLRSSVASIHGDARNA